jgi:sugar phosphate isomerase/epimerase
MELGIFAKTFIRPTLQETLDEVKASGINIIQFNMVCAGMESMPKKVDLKKAYEIKSETQKRDIQICAVSGTFNMAHPDPNVRKDGICRLRNLTEMCKTMGTSIITLCTGSRNELNKWEWHEENNTEEAWSDMISSIELALQIAEEYQVTLAIEPEAANVIYNAKRAKKLLKLMNSPRLKIIMDAANLFHNQDIAEMRDTMREAFELLGEDIILAHAKDLNVYKGISFLPAGQGILDYDFYLSLLKSYSYNGPLIMHGLEEHQVKDSVTFLRSKLKGVK